MVERISRGGIKEEVKGKYASHWRRRLSIRRDDKACTVYLFVSGLLIRSRVSLIIIRVQGARFVLVLINLKDEEERGFISDLNLRPHIWPSPRQATSSNGAVKSPRYLREGFLKILADQLLLDLTVSFWRGRKRRRGKKRRKGKGR